MTDSMKVAYTSIIGTVLFFLTFGVAYVFDSTSIQAVSWLEAFAVWTSYICTIMVVAGMRLNFLFAVVTTAAYCILFWHTDLLASAGLNAYLFPMAIFGWFMWGHGETRKVTSVFSNINFVNSAALAGTTLIIYGVTVWIVQSLGGLMPWQDSAILLLTIVAQILMSFRKIENWLVWIPVNLFGIYVYSEAGLILVALQYWFFLFNAFVALFVWNRHRVAGTLLD